MYTSVILSLIASYVVISILFLASLWLCRKLTSSPPGVITAFGIILLLCWMVSTILLDLIVLYAAITLIVTGAPPVWS